MIKRTISKIQSYFVEKYVQKAKLKFGLNVIEKRDKKIIVSLASYNMRYDTIGLMLKSLLLQTKKPDKIIVWLDEEKEENQITEEMSQLVKYGIEYRYTTKLLKPHKKYFYAMQEFPDDIIITVDDDCIYSANMIKTLLKTHKKYPNAVCARRVHLMTFEEQGKLSNYEKWEKEFCKMKKPTYLLCAVGNGGILYPPHIMPKEAFNVENIQRYCIEADDLWLKTMELLQQVKVVWTPNYYVRPKAVKNSQLVRLYDTNKGIEGNNNKALAALQREYPDAWALLKSIKSELLCGRNKL